MLSHIQAQECLQSIQLLDILEFPISNSLKTYQLASKIAVQLNHHLFDTLYHAVAINQQATLMTADTKYYQKAKKLGSIALLRDYQF